MIEANDILKAQALLDRCRRSGSAVYLWRGEIHITGAKPSGQRLTQVRKHEQGIRQLLGDDGKAHPWAVSQLPGGTLLYQHPHARLVLALDRIEQPQVLCRAAANQRQEHNGGSRHSLCCEHGVSNSSNAIFTDSDVSVI